MSEKILYFGEKPIDGQFLAHILKNSESGGQNILIGASHPAVQKPIQDLWEDIPDTWDKPKLCRIDDPDCEACQ